MADTDKTTIELGGRTVKLVPPQSYALRWDVATAGAKNASRALAAALAACWPRRPGFPGETRKRPRPTYERAGYEVGAYGGQVIDWLVAEGIPMAEIAYAGTVAYSLVSEGLFGEQEVQEAEDFTEAPEAGQTE